jgi:uncharacterized membrane protein
MFCSVVLFPVAVTFFITWWFIQFVDGFFSPLYAKLGIDIFGKSCMYVFSSLIVVDIDYTGIIWSLDLCSMSFVKILLICYATYIAVSRI